MRHCPLWILDEPFTALDRASRKIFEALMAKHLEHDGMIVLTSHHPVNLPESAVQTINLSA
jgi:heme exporter protein A